MGEPPTGMGQVVRARWCLDAIALLALTAGFFLALSQGASADDVLAQPRDNFGGVGLIEMPSARMAPDGTIATGASFFRHNQHYNIVFQVLPWLEGSFRYSGLQGFDPHYPVYYDRSFALKARLWDETSIVPAVSVGINDIVGTGIYSGEYLVASKQFGSIDATLGIGWGRMATTDLFKNPLTYLSSSFAKRTPTQDFSPGSANFSSFFHGPYAGLFGGLVWHTPLDGLSLIGEYSSDRYISETFSKDLEPRGQVNIGASYNIGSATFGLAWIYGTTLNGSVIFALDPTHDPFPQHLGDPAMPPAHLRTQAEQQQALNNLLEQRKPQSALLFSASGLNALSDALFAETGDITDVSLSGQTLLLGIGTGDVRAICNNAAGMAARYNVDLRDVAVSDARGRSAHCAVQRRGAGVIVNATLEQNPAAPRLTILAPAALLTIDASAPAQPSPQSALEKIKADAAKQQVTIVAISLTESEAIVYYANLRYSHEPDAVKRLVRILMADAPPNIEKFRLLPTLGGVPQDEFDVLRAPTERAIAQTGSYNLLADGNSLSDAPLQNPVLSDALRGTYPKFGWTVFPQFRQELFDPDNPFAVQFLAAAQGVVEFQPGLEAVGEAETSLYDNFNVHRNGDSQLPHVRTDWARFFTEGKNGLGQLELDYLTRLAPDVFAQARAGYLESMFAGVGGEVLWRPEGQRWALGFDLYRVQERDFNRLLGLQSYKTTTGHATIYYASPWYGLNFQFRAGQYLAGDHGFTLQMSRRFSTGVELGVFFSKTNVSAEKFGEGSFDKGFTLTIPLDWVMPVSTQNAFSTVIRPVQRDGGQTLEGDANLYGYLQRTGTADVLAHADDFAGEQ